MTQRDGMGREVERGLQVWEQVYTHGIFMFVFGKTITIL